MMSKIAKLFAVLLLLSACGEENSNLTKMVIHTSDGDVTYHLEKAITKDQLQHGLMERKELKSDSGMLFLLQGQNEIAMWMKDTYIPLDMIFIGQNKRIIAVYKNAKPLSTELIRPRVSEPLSAVVELNGGDIDKHNIKIGDKIDNDMIQQVKFPINQEKSEN